MKLGPCLFIWIYSDPEVDRIWTCKTYTIKWDEVWKFNILDFSMIIYTVYIYCIYIQYIYILYIYI